MINVTVYHNSINGASRAANELFEFIRAQIDTRVVGRQPYHSLLPLRPNLREYGTQLCHVEVSATPAHVSPDQLKTAFQRVGFDSKVALFIEHHDDPVSAGTAEFIRWRLARLLNPLNMAIGIGANAALMPACMPVITNFTVNYYCMDVEAITDPALDAKAPTERIMGEIIPTLALDHGNYIDLYGLGLPIDRVYLQHPMNLDKSVSVSFVPKEEGWLLCASQFNQTSYENQSRALYLTQAQADKFFALYGEGPLYIAAGDTPLDLFYEMLYLCFSEE